MDLINQITMHIIKYAKDGESIYSLAKRIGFAYSAVYRWVGALEKYEVLHIIRKGNTNVIKINKNKIYTTCKELWKMIRVIEKDRLFWKIIKKTNLKIRCVQSTAIVIWTQGSYIPGDFSERRYFLEVTKKDASALKAILKKADIKYQEGLSTKERPVVHIQVKESLSVEQKNGLPVMPLQDLVAWCKELSLDSVLEQLDELYALKLNVKYAEINTNQSHG